MKRISLIIGILLVVLTLESCAQKSNNSNSENFDLTATEFQSKISETKDPIILDVRTPGEFKGGFIEGALNYNWNGNNFQEQVAQLDKKETVFVYCLSGGRSGAAAKSLRNQGFEKVYELNGGMMSWRSNGLPETKQQLQQDQGMSLKEYREQIQTENWVLVDFYAEWCQPCKKMAPYLKEIAEEMSDSVTVVKIDADKNKSLVQGLNISGLPTLILYKEGKEQWKHQGFIDKAGVLEEIK